MLTICKAKAETTYPNLVHYFADLRFKPHVQHAVSFVQHQIGATTQISLTALQEINETTRSGDANLNTLNKNRENSVFKLKTNTIKL